MYSKIISLSAAFLLGSLSLCAYTSDDLIKQIRKDVTKVITQAMPFEAYKQALENTQNPSYENLQPLFADLTVFNDDFNKKNISDKNQLAKYLTQPVKVGWNTYRKVDMLEIFKYYFPQENYNKDIALLEYNVKSNLLTPSQRAEISMFKNTNDEEATKLYNSYEQFAKTLQSVTSYNPKQLITSLVELIRTCNQIEQTSPDIVTLAKKSLFIQPILAGWGRTITIAEINTKLGIEKDIYGDGINFYSPKRLQEIYGLSSQDAELMDKFEREYHIEK